MSIASGQGGVGGSVAYYLYLNGILEGVVNPVDAGNFEGNWATPGVSTYSSASSSGSTGSSGVSSSSPSVSTGTKPTDSTSAAGSSGTATQAAPTPAVDARSANPTGASEGAGPSFTGATGSKSVTFSGSGEVAQSQGGSTPVAGGYGSAQLGARSGPALNAQSFSTKVNMSL